MRRQFGRILGSAWMAVALATTGFPQASSPAAKPNALPVKVQVVFTRSEGDKKVSSPYSFVISSSGEPSSLRIGIEVPTSAALEQMGTQINSSVTPADDGRFKLLLDFKGRFFNEHIHLARRGIHEVCGDR
jgi:hypothetical protein